MKLFAKVTIILMSLLVITGCGGKTDSNPNYEMTSSKNSQEMYENAGLPGSAKYKNNVSNLNTNDFKKESLSPKEKAKSKKKK